MLGDLRADHWFVYVADYCERAMEYSTDCNVNIMMYGLATEVQALFQMNQYGTDMSLRDAALKVRCLSGIDTLVEVRADPTRPCSNSLSRANPHFWPNSCKPSRLALTS